MGMNSRLSLLPTVILAFLSATTAAYAQIPETKLTRTFTPATVQALWCSALMLEERYHYDEGTEEAVYWEEMAYALGDSLDELMAEEGLAPIESEEVWAIFDDAAIEFAENDSENYLTQLEGCEDAYNSNKLKLR